MYRLQSGKRFIRTIRPGAAFYIDQLVPAAGITLVFGPPSCGKSTLLWTMAEAMWTKQKFLGKFPTHKARTLFLNVDMPGDALWRRFNGAKYEPRFWICDFSNHFNITTLQATNPGVFQALQATAHRFQVVMIDSLSTITTGLSLRDDWVPGLTISALRSLFPTQAIVLLHHSRKQTIGQFGPVPPHREDALGSQFWMAMVQSEMQMYLKGDHLAHLRLVKSQVATLGDGDDVYVDDAGCRVLPYSASSAAQWLTRLAGAEQHAIALDPTYKNRGLVERYELMGKLLSPAASGKTIQRWVKRSGYVML